MIASTDRARRLPVEWLEAQAAFITARVGNGSAAAPLVVRRAVVEEVIATFDALYGHELLRQLYLAPHLDDDAAADAVARALAAAPVLVRHLTSLSDVLLGDLLAPGRTGCGSLGMRTTAPEIGAASDGLFAEGVRFDPAGAAFVPATFLETLQAIAHRRAIEALQAAGLPSAETADVLAATARSLACAFHRAGRADFAARLLEPLTCAEAPDLGTLLIGLVRGDIPFFLACLERHVFVRDGAPFHLDGLYEAAPHVIGALIEALPLRPAARVCLARAWEAARHLAEQDLPRAIKLELMAHALDAMQDDLQDAECASLALWMNETEPFEGWHVRPPRVAQVVALTPKPARDHTRIRARA